MATLRKAGDEIAQPMGGAVVFWTGDLVVGRRIWRLFTEPSRSRGVRVLAHLTLANMELMTGRWSAAKVEIDSAMALDSATALEHRALLSLWPLQQVSRSELLALRNALQRWRAVPGPFNESSVTPMHAPAHPYLRLYLLGLLSVRLDDHAAAVDYAAELERRAGKSFAPAFVRGLGRAVRVEVARARGRAEQALATLDSAGFWAPEDTKQECGGDSPFHAHEYERFARAELLDSLGRPGEALQTYQFIADPAFPRRGSGPPPHGTDLRAAGRAAEGGRLLCPVRRAVEGLRPRVPASGRRGPTPNGRVKRRDGMLDEGLGVPHGFPWLRASRRSREWMKPHTTMHAMQECDNRPRSRTAESLEGTRWLKFIP